jgi:DoxX-like protein
MNLAHPGVVHKDIAQQRLVRTSAKASPNAWSRAGNVLMYFLSFVLIGSAAAKLLPVPPVAIGMAQLGFDGRKLIFIALLEIASALLFAYRRTRAFGLLMVSAYLGGAVAVHVGHDQLPLQPAVVLALFWLSVWLRYPQLFSRSN